MDKALDSLPELFYDVLAIFIPGFYCYFCFSLIYEKENLSKVVAIPLINETIDALIMVYLLGFVVYFLSSYIIARIFRFLFGDPRFILLGSIPNKRQEFLNKYFLEEHSVSTIEHYKKNVEIRIRFILKDANYEVLKNLDPAFELCRNYVMEKGTRSISIRKEQAYGEMSRGIVLISLISLIILFIYTGYYGNIVNNYWFVFGLFSFSLITFSFRYGQARHINPIFIYNTFISAVELNSNPNEKKIISL